MTQDACEGGEKSTNVWPRGRSVRWQIPMQSTCGVTSQTHPSVGSKHSIDTSLPFASGHDVSKSDIARWERGHHFTSRMSGSGVWKKMCQDSRTMNFLFTQTSLFETQNCMLQLSWYKWHVSIIMIAKKTLRDKRMSHQIGFQLHIQYYCLDQLSTPSPTWPQRPLTLPFQLLHDVASCLVQICLRTSTVKHSRITLLTHSSTNTSTKWIHSINRTFEYSYTHQRLFKCMPPKQLYRSGSQTLVLAT